MKLSGIVHAATRANRIFAELKKKYPEMKAYLVLSNRFGQCDLTISEKEIFHGFKESFVETKEKEDLAAAFHKVETIRKMAGALAFARTKTDQEKQKKQIEEFRAKEEILNNDITVLLQTLEFRDDVNIEIRFKELDYPIIRSLQVDPLIDRELTPQVKASIRIIIGRIEALTAKEYEDNGIKL